MNASEMYTLRKEIRSAFKNVTPPGKKIGGGSMEEYATFKDASWDDISLNDVLALGSFTLFWPKALRYFLPHFMDLAIQYKHQDIIEWLLDVLANYDTIWANYPGIWGKSKRRSLRAFFSEQQQEVIVRFVQSLTALSPNSFQEPSYPKDKANRNKQNLAKALEYWRQS